MIAQIVAFFLFHHGERLLLPILALEAIFGRSSLHDLYARRASTWIDIGWFLWRSILVDFEPAWWLLTVAALGLPLLAPGFEARLRDVSPGVSTGSFLLDGVASYLLVAFADYWRHRVLHRWGWRLHRHHHSATPLSPWTAYRLHPIDYGTATLTGGLAVLVLGSGYYETLVGVGLVIGTSNLLAHARLPWSYGWVGRWLVMSPASHRLHHEEDRWNLSGCPLWDRVFGTWRDPKADSPGAPDRSS